MRWRGCQAYIVVLWQENAIYSGRRSPGVRDFLGAVDTFPFPFKPSAKHVDKVYRPLGQYNKDTNPLKRHLKGKGIQAPGVLHEEGRKNEGRLSEALPLG